MGGLVVLGCLLGSLVWAGVPVNFYALKSLNRLGGFEENDGLGYNLAVADLGSDGKTEIILGALKEQSPVVKIFRADGSFLDAFLAYKDNFRGGVSVAACDLNGDGQAEIITGAGETGGPHIRVFDSYGHPTVNDGFFAFDKTEYRWGVSVACANLNGDGNKILVASSYGYEPVVKIFNPDASYYGMFEVNNYGSLKGINLASIDLGGDGKQEIVISGQYGSQPYVGIYRADGSLITEFLAYEENFRGGVSVAAYDYDNQPGQEIITAAGFTGGPHVKIFKADGSLLEESFVGKAQDSRGLNIALGELNGDGQADLVTVVQNTQTGDMRYGRYVDIDVTKQRFGWYDLGYKVEEYITSTGKRSTPTRLGEFQVLSKHEMAYGAGDGQTWGMPKFVGFYNAGSVQNGIHALPYINGIKEGPGSLGTAVSHGCVRLDDMPAAKFFDWIKLGDIITVHR